MFLDTEKDPGIGLIPFPIVGWYNIQTHFLPIVSLVFATKKNILRSYLIFFRTTFVEVFATLFWIVFVFVTFCFLIFGLFSFKFVHDEVPVENKDISGIVFLSLLAKEIWISPKRLPGKIFILTLGLTGAIISYSYNAGLVSLLSVEIFWYPIKSIEVNK